MTLLRIALPPLEHLTANTELEFACLEHRGRVGQTGVSTLMQIGQQTGSRAVECFLHPADSVMTSIELPPLSAARVRAAVGCAVQTLILGDKDRLHVAHSARDGNGQVHVSWLAKAELDRLARLLAQHRLTLRGLYPAPYRLALPPAGHISACLLDDHLLLRQSAEQGAVEPLMEDRLDDLLTDGDRVNWIGQGAPGESLDEKPAALYWSGIAPNWGLHGGVRQADTGRRSWGRALACCAVALAVWVIGLNLYAAREALQGQQLKAQMTQRVKQAFPELPVILNPLQQARQQLTARQQGTADDPAQGFNRLVLQAGSSMPFMMGSVQRLVFADGALQLSLLAEASRSDNDKGWQGALAQAGISVSATDDGWVLRPAAEVISTDDSSGAEDE